MGQYLPNQGAPFEATSVTKSDGSQIQVVTSGLSIPDHDEIVLSYTGANLTGVVYKLATVTVATLTLSYTGDNLTGVVKS
jgi:hypothetical protein